MLLKMCLIRYVIDGRVCAGPFFYTSKEWMEGQAEKHDFEIIRELNPKGFDLTIIEDEFGLS